MNQYFIGLDIGGTNVKVVLWNQTRQRIEHKEIRPFKNATTSDEELRTNVMDPIEQMCTEANVVLSQVKAIGISIGAQFNRENGDIVRWNHHPKWSGLCLKNQLQNHFHTDLFLEDDANCAAVGEYEEINNTVVRDVIYITVGTGIGCGIILDGRLFVGGNGSAGELGHIKIGNPFAPCSCGENGCLQATLSGNAIKQTLIKFHKHRGVELDQESCLHNILLDKSIDGTICSEVFNEAVDVFCNAIFSLERLFDIQHFIIGGGIVSEKEYFFEPLQQKMRRFSSGIYIYLSQLGGYSGAIGIVRMMVKKYT